MLVYFTSDILFKILTTTICFNWWFSNKYGIVFNSSLLQICYSKFYREVIIKHYYILVNSDWLIPYKEGRPGAVTQPPGVYFCQSKLDVWSHVADQAIEALASCKQHLGQFLENTHRDIVSQLTGLCSFKIWKSQKIKISYKYCTIELSVMQIYVFLIPNWEFFWQFLNWLL